MCGLDHEPDQREVRVATDTVASRSWGAVAGTLAGRTCSGEVVPLAGTEVWVKGRDESHTLRRPDVVTDAWPRPLLH